MNASSPGILFPYMAFARTQASRSRHCLTQSGMRPPDPRMFGPPPPLDLAFAGAEALPALEERLAQLHGTTRERVIVTPGASAALHILALRYLRGARVATDVPSYEPFRALPRLLGSDLRSVRRRREERWRLDPEAVRHALGPRSAGAPGHVFTTNTHNPTGALTSAADVRELAQVAAAAGGVLVSCEVYMQYAPPAERVEAWKLAPNAITIGSLTKAHGLGALRIGWIVLGDGVAADRARIEDMAFLAYVDPPTPALRAALLALEHLPALAERIAACERAGKPHLARFLAETEGVEGELAPFGLIAFPFLAGVPDTAAFAAWLAREWDVDVVPGEYFGAPGHVRLGFGEAEHDVQTGLERLAQGLEAWRASGVRRG